MGEPHAVAWGAVAGWGESLRRHKKTKTGSTHTFAAHDLHMEVVHPEVSGIFFKREKGVVSSYRPPLQHHGGSPRPSL